MPGIRSNGFSIQFAALALLATTLMPTVPARALSYLEAVTDYNKGRYTQALSKFRQLAADHPKNAINHYYLALCHQSLGQIDQAKTEFLWVTANGEERLKGLAYKEMGQLAYGKQQEEFVSIEQLTTTPSPAVSPNAPRPKVKKIMEFYANWCVPCKAFGPVFDATKPKFRDVNFQKLNVDDQSNRELVMKYSAQKIPHLVFLDAGGKQLFNGYCPKTEAGFTHLINQFR